MFAGCVRALNISKWLVTSHGPLLIHHVLNFGVVVIIGWRPLIMWLLRNLLHLIELDLSRLSAGYARFAS